MDLFTETDPAVAAFKVRRMAKERKKTRTEPYHGRRKCTYSFCEWHPNGRRTRRKA